MMTNLAAHDGIDSMKELFVHEINKLYRFKEV